MRLLDLDRRISKLEKASNDMLRVGIDVSAKIDSLREEKRKVVGAAFIRKRATQLRR